jgi:hypothetical protein
MAHDGVKFWDYIKVVDIHTTGREEEWITKLQFINLQNWGVKLSTNQYLIPKLRMRGNMPPLLHTLALHDS